jgi:hypothetical protein
VWARGLVGVLVCLAGGVFFGQGIGVIHGSFMTGEAVWAVIGALLVAAGVALLGWARWIRPDRKL